MKKILFIFFMFFTAINVIAQDTTVYILIGKVIDVETNKPIPAATIVNVNKLFGMQTDTSGNYRILMTQKDSIKISCIGYHTIFWKPDFSKSIGGLISAPIIMEPKTYQIGKVDIYKLRWSAFVYEVSQTEIKEDEVQTRLIKWITKLVENEDLASINLKEGIQIPLPIVTSREKQLKKIYEQKKIDELNKQANEKFNPTFVSRITGLQDEELDDFMKYCSFERDFILKSSEYDLIVIIQDIYKEYQLKKY